MESWELEVAVFLTTKATPLKVKKAAKVERKVEMERVLTSSVSWVFLKTTVLPFDSLRHPPH